MEGGRESSQEAPPPTNQVGVRSILDPSSLPPIRVQKREHSLRTKTLVVTSILKIFSQPSLPTPRPIRQYSRGFKNFRKQPTKSCHRAQHDRSSPLRLPQLHRQLLRRSRSGGPQLRLSQLRPRVHRDASRIRLRPSSPTPFPSSSPENSIFSKTTSTN